MGKERVLSGQSPKSLRNNPSSCETFFFLLSKGDKEEFYRVWGTILCMFFQIFK